VVDTLLKMKAAGFARSVAPLVDSVPGVDSEAGAPVPRAVSGI